MLKNPFVTGRNKTVYIYVGLVIVLLLFPLVVSSTFYIHILILSFIYVIAAGSLRLISTSGQISMGHAGFMGIGAYVSIYLSKFLGVSPWISMAIAALITLIIALIVGIPFARLRGIYFTMITLFFGLGALSIEQLFSDYTGGYSGIAGIPALFSTDSKIPYYYFFLILVTVCLIIMFRLEHSRIGQTWKAVAQSYSVASSIGINELQQRVLVFAIGCAFAGLAGAGLAHYSLVLSQSNFNLLASMYLIVYVLVGGIASFAGPIIGTAILVMIPEMSRSLKDYVPLLFAAIMLIVLFTMPKGLAGLPAQVKGWFHRKNKGNTPKEVINNAS